MQQVRTHDGVFGKKGWFVKDRFDWDKPNNIEVYA